MVKWYLPTFYGDIRLESLTEDRTEVTFHGLTAEEKTAAEALVKRAGTEGAKKRWATPEALAALNLDDTVKEQKLVLQAKITEVEQVLSKALKPTRQLLRAVRIHGGKIEEMTEASAGLIVTRAESAEDVAGTTVAPPVRGCPPPDFAPADIRATEVLSAFLTPEQRRDFARHGAFVAMGAESGHRYQLTSRHARAELLTKRRTLFDLDEGVPYCVHDWDVPAAEELLSILICLSLPGREAYLRALPD